MNKPPITHTPACEEYSKAAAAFVAAHPHLCELCQGAARTDHYDGDTGHTDHEWCDWCVLFGLCPWCSGPLLPHKSDHDQPWEEWAENNVLRCADSSCWNQNRNESAQYTCECDL